MGIKTVSATILSSYTPGDSPRRVLLFNPPVYDTRFPWSRWQQPVTLLQLATLLRGKQCDIRLIDALYVKPNENLKRRRARVLTRGEVSINYWRFGQLKSDLAAKFKSLDQDGWEPDDVYIEGFTTFWWEGVIEAITLVRKRFPKARVILCGAYPSLAAEHAIAH